MSENGDVTSQAQHHSHGKQHLKRCMLRRLRKIGSDCTDVTCCGRLFHIWAAATGKARSPNVDHRVRRMTSDDDDAERSRHRASKSIGSRIRQQRTTVLLPADTGKESELVVNRLSRLQPVKFVKERSE